MDKKGYSLEGDTIIIKRNLNELDLFVKDFLETLKKYSDYLIVSGFVSISTGRTRGTEDVDIIFPLMKKEQFALLFQDLEKNNFWCYQSDNAEEAYEYIKDLQSVRFARDEQLFPNIEFIPFNDFRPLKVLEFNNPQKIKIDNFKFKIPPIEFEILYKEIILSSEKDFSDARHLRNFFSDIIREDKFKEYEKAIKRYKK